MKTFLVACLLALVPTTMVSAGDFPPETSKPLSEVLKTLENLSLQDFTEVDFDHGHWEIEAIRKGAAVEVFVDPQSTKIVHEESDDHHTALPAGAKSLSAIAKQLEDAGYRAIAEIDLEGMAWEIDALRSGTRYELRVDVRSGLIVSERTRRR